MSTWIEQKWQGIVRWHVSAYNAGGWGRLKLILAWFAVVALIGTMNSEPLTSVEVHGAKAVIHKKILSSHLLESLAVQTLGEVYELAREHPDVNYVRVAFTMSKAGLSDKYGNPAKDDIQMGELSWDAGALDEARRYTERARYSTHEMHVAIYMDAIKRMDGGHLLSNR